MIHKINLNHVSCHERKPHLKRKLSKILDIKKENLTVLTLKYNNVKFKFNLYGFYIIKNTYIYSPEFRYSQIGEIKIDTENNLFIIDDWMAIKYD